MKPFFTIIIPTLNEEKYLPKLLESLIKQKVRNFETIIIDGNSQDKTNIIATFYKKKLPLRFKSLSSGNLSLQKNTGATLAQGKYLIFFDADMVIRRNFTYKAERELQKRKGFVFVPYVYPIEKKEYPDVHAAMTFFNQLVGLSLETKKPFSAGPSQIWDKEIFFKINGFDNIFGEDHFIIRKAQEWGIHVTQLPSLKVWFSLRRLKKQGRIRLFTHFIRTHIQLLFYSKVGKSFEYQMGGHMYEDKKRKLGDFSGINPQKVLLEFNKRVRSFLQD